MSMESWIAEFYPIAANKVNTPEAALEHSIKKWSGLTKENLQKHELYRVTRHIGDECFDKVFHVGSDTCALCEVHDGECRKCILQNCNSEYIAFTMGGDPLKMLALLRSKAK